MTRLFAAILLLLPVISHSTGMISDLIKRLNQLEPADWAEAAVVYRIERR